MDKVFFFNVNKWLRQPSDFSSIDFFGGFFSVMNYLLKNECAACLAISSLIAVGNPILRTLEFLMKCEATHFCY